MEIMLELFKKTCFNLEIKLIILLLNFVNIVLAKNIITATVLFYCEAKILKKNRIYVQSCIL